MTGPERYRVVRVSDLAGIAEIAARFGVTRQAVCNWGVRHRHFPQPVVVLKSGPVYDMTEIVHWHKSNPPYHRS